MITSAELLGIWERGVAQTPLGRSLTLLAAAMPGEATEELSQMSVGERNARLLALRKDAFGDDLVGLASCPDCEEQLELRFRASDLLAIGATPETTGAGQLTVTVGGWTARVRRLTTADLEAIVNAPDMAVARQVLLARCVLEVCQDNAAVALDVVPSEVLDAIEAQLAAADPQADVEFPLQCPGCGVSWEQSFDITYFMWAEVDLWAGRTLREVHRLASAYGWGEQEILAMTATRRQAYLDLVTDA